MSSVSLRRVLVALLTTCGAMLLLAPLAPAGTLTYNARFAVDDVDPWGGTGVDRASQAYDVRWNEQGGASQTDSLLGMDFGGSINAATSGHLGIEFGYDAANGTLDIDYPAVVDVSYPDDETYFPGDTIRIATTNRSTAGSFDFDPGAQDYSITGKLALAASASGELCFVSCFGTIPFFPAFSQGETPISLLSAHAAAGQYGDIWDPPAGSGFTHVTGDVTIAKPDVALDVAEQGRMYADSQQSFLDADVDIDAFSKAPLGKSFSSGGVELSYDVLDGRVHLDGEERHTFDFAPTVHLTFTFPRVLSYRIVNGDGTFAGAARTGASAELVAGQSLDLTLPVDQTQPFSITPTLTLANTVNHQLTHVYQVQGTIKVLRASAGFPSREITPEICLPLVPCIPALEFPGFTFGVGPVYSTNVPIATTRPTLFDRTWAIAFPPHVQAARGFDPENIPVANAGGEYDVDEGSSITLDGTASFDLDADDVLTYAWSLDAVGSLEATGPTPTFEGLDGEQVYVATLEVCDLKRNCHADSATVRVHNVVPSHVLDTTSTIAFGIGKAYLARVGVPVAHSATANDVGTDDTTYAWSSGAAASWTPASSTYFNDGVAADARISAFGTLPFATASSASVTYSQPGAFTQQVVVSDDDAGATSTSVPVLVADTATKVRSIGSFKQQYSLDGTRELSVVQLDAYLAFARAGSRVFDERRALGTTADAHAVLQGIDDRQATTVDQAHAFTLAAWLNVASGAVAWDGMLPRHQVKPGRATVADAMREVETVLLDPAATKAQVLAAMQLAQSIGGG